MRKRFALFAMILVLAGMACSGCTWGREYETGILPREHIHAGLVEFERDNSGVRYNLFTEQFASAGATGYGTQFTSVLGGGVLSANVPGAAWILYPFQYADCPDEARAFGIGTGNGDLRLSLLWGFLSLGRNWNVLWWNGFWWNRRDPLMKYGKVRPWKEREINIDLRSRRLLLPQTRGKGAGVPGHTRLLRTRSSEEAG